MGFNSLLLMIEILFGFYGALAGEEQFSHRSWRSLQCIHKGGRDPQVSPPSPRVGWVGEDAVLAWHPGWARSTGMPSGTGCFSWKEVVGVVTPAAFADG